MNAYRYLGSMMFCCILFAATSAPAQQPGALPDIPRVISYQGMLTSSNGVPVTDGQHQATITLYADENGAEMIWQDTYTITSRGGVFSVYLGAGPLPLPSPDRMDKPLWVGMQLAGTEEMRPLTRLSASPYAINVPDKSITTEKIADGAVTEDKVRMDYIAGVSVNGRKIEVNGKVLNIQGGDDIDVRYDETTQSLVIDSKPAARKGELEEKSEDRELQGTALDAWGMRGEGVDVPGATPVAANAADYIGTNDPVRFNIKVDGQAIMSYIPNGTNSPSVEGGHDDNSVPLTGVGNVIAGGGGAGGSANTITGADLSFIGGGAANSITDDGSVVGGGSINQAQGRFNVIGGGSQNTTQGENTTVAGGLVNAAKASFSAIGGGANNSIPNNADFSVVAGGHQNDVYASASGILGGDSNNIHSSYSMIGGGDRNIIGTSSPYSSIAGGSANHIGGYNGFIGGGDRNTLIGFTFHSVIAGGLLNSADHGTSAVTIAGGDQNKIDSFAFVSSIGGGLHNRITRDVQAGTVSGGENNTVTSSYGSISGGRNNSAQRLSATVGGGEFNAAADSASTVSGGGSNSAGSIYSTIGGGKENTIEKNAPYSTIGGGIKNTIVEDLSYSTIGGGSGNKILYSYAVVGGGKENTAQGFASTVSGGEFNLAAGEVSGVSSGAGNSVHGTYSAIGGGASNLIEEGARYSVISGGIRNKITGAAYAGSIPGGDSLIAQSYAQTVTGSWNIARGNVSTGPVLPSNPILNGPIFVVGNGGITSTARSNAFEVSYNGHSTVFQVNGSGSTSTGAAIVGSTYMDNIVYAWGDVQSSGMANCDFGVDSVWRMGAGWYRVRLNMASPYGGGAAALGCGSITATINTNSLPTTVAQGKCRFISTTLMRGLEFDVFITEQRFNRTTMNLECVHVDEPFMFKVTGAPVFTLAPPGGGLQ